MRRIAAFLALASLVAGPAAAGPLVMAASSLADALPEVGAAWERAGGEHVDFAFGGSGDLARQVEQGAPADLFFSADESKMDRLEAAGLLEAGTRHGVLSNRLVVVVPADSDSRVGSAEDLASFDRVVLGNPDTVAVGAYARRWLESAGAWPRVRPKVVPVLDARAALAAVADGHAPAGVVFATDAASTTRVRVAFEVPRGESPPIVYPLAVVRGARHPRAGELANFIASPVARPIFERHGFLVLPAR